MRIVYMRQIKAGSYCQLVDGVNYIDTPWGYMRGY